MATIHKYKEKMNKKFLNNFAMLWSWNYVPVKKRTAKVLSRDRSFDAHLN